MGATWIEKQKKHCNVALGSLSHLLCSVSLRSQDPHFYSGTKNLIPRYDKQGCATSHLLWVSFQCLSQVVGIVKTSHRAGNFEVPGFAAMFGAGFSQVWLAKVLQPSRWHCKLQYSLQGLKAYPGFSRGHTSWLKTLHYKYNTQSTSWLLPRVPLVSAN